LSANASPRRSHWPARTSTQVGEVLPLPYLHDPSSDFSGMGVAPRQRRRLVARFDHSRPTAQQQDEAPAVAQRVLTDRPRLSVGRRNPPENSPRAEETVLVGNARSPRRRPQGTRCTHRRPLRVHRLGGRTCCGTAADAGYRLRRRLVGDGSLGFRKALREVIPETLEQRRSQFHKRANALAALTKSEHRSATAARKDIYNAEGIDQAQHAIDAFARDSGRSIRRQSRRSPTTPMCRSSTSLDPAEQRVNLRTTNPIGSTFATVQLRAKATESPGSRAAGTAMAHKPIEAAGAQARRQHTAPRSWCAPARCSTKANSWNGPSTSPELSPETLVSEVARRSHSARKEDDATAQPEKHTLPTNPLEDKVIRAIVSTSVCRPHM